MSVEVYRTTPVAWNILEGIIPPEYFAYLKKDCINEKHLTLYTASESEEDALGYLLLAPVHYLRTMYEIAHMQVVLEETKKHIGSMLIDQVVEDLNRNEIKTLCASFDEEDDEEGITESFFKANGFQNKNTYCVHRFSVQQILDSSVREKLYKIPLINHCKSYDDLSRVMKDYLINKVKLTINSGNKGNLYFIVIDGQVVAMSGIYRMKDSIVLDDIHVFDRTYLKNIVILIWANFTKFVCNTYKKENYNTVEIVLPSIKNEEVSLGLIGEPISKAIKKKMILDL